MSDLRPFGFARRQAGIPPRALNLINRAWFYAYRNKYTRMWNKNIKMPGISAIAKDSTRFPGICEIRGVLAG
jgi:hypothetical protein